MLSFVCDYCGRIIPKTEKALSPTIFVCDPATGRHEDIVDIPGICVDNLHYHDVCLAALFSMDYQDPPEEEPVPEADIEDEEPDTEHEEYLERVRRGTRDNIRAVVARLWNEGNTVTQIAEVTQRSVSTILYHMKNLREEFGDEAVEAREVPEE